MWKIISWYGISKDLYTDIYDNHIYGFRAWLTSRPNLKE